MNTKEGVKLGIAISIIAVAIGLFVYRTRAAADAADDSKTFWYCTQANKGFEVAGPDYDRNVRTGRKNAAPQPEGTVSRARLSDNLVTQAKSPYSGDWTGVPASKCGDCGEIFELKTDSQGENLCPKCNWNPVTQSKGPSNLAPPPPEKSE